MTNWYAVAVAVIGAIFLFVALIVYLIEGKNEWYIYVLLAIGVIMLIVGVVWLLFYPDHPSKTSDELKKMNVTKMM